MLKPVLLAAAVAAITTVSAQAATVINGQANLSNPAVAVGFDEFPVAPGVEVSNEFASLGVTFSGLLHATGGFSPRANTSGALLFGLGPINASISFDSVINDATFALSSNAGDVTVTSLRNGSVVETFTASLANTTASNGSGVRLGNVFGFTGSAFDQITFSTSGSAEASFDNLAFNAMPTPVPTPASLPLLLVAAGGLVALRRRKSRD